MMYIVDPKAVSLVKIAELGSFTKAAEELCITQPAISQHIKLLEEEFGVKLFERLHNEVQLTPAGKIAVKYISKMISISNNMEKRIKDQESNITSITVGITHTVESTSIVEALANYAKSHEGLTFKIISNSSDILYRMLKNDELDFLIVEGKSDSNEFKYSMLGTDCLVLITSPDHPLASNTTVTINELKNESLILRLPNSNTRNMFQNALRKQNVVIEEFNTILEIDNIATIKDLVRRDIGVSVLSKSACLDEIKKGKLAVLTIENLSMVREINIVYSDKFEYPEIIKGVTQRFNGM